MTESEAVYLNTDARLPESESAGERDIDMPDEWGRQSFPASDPPQNW
jgi:hypothetical protein